MRILLCLLLWAAALPACAARGVVSGTIPGSIVGVPAPLPVQVILGRLALTLQSPSVQLEHLEPYAFRLGVVRYAPTDGSGHYDFDARRVTLASLLATIPAEHAVPAAAHEFQHMHEHEKGLLATETFDGEIRAHEVQAKATLIALRLGWLSGEVVETGSPTLGVMVPIVVPERLAPAARELLSNGRVDAEDEALVRYYRSLATTLTAHKRGMLDKIIRRFYPQLLH